MGKKQTSSQDDENDQVDEKPVNLFLIEALKAEGVDHIFLVPGGMINPFMPNYSVAGVRAIVACHEAGAAYMADGYARARRSFAVCMGIGGPGVTNMVTAIAAAYGDRSPVMVLAGTVPLSWEGLSPFQDSSQTGIPDSLIMQGITVSNLQVPLPESSGHFLRMTIRAMMGVVNRPGFLQVPWYMQSVKIRDTYKPVEPSVARVVDNERVQAIPEILSTGTRITFLVGNGAQLSDASSEIEAFAEKYCIPVATTIRAKGAIPEDNKMSLGVFGMGGSWQANAVMLGSGNSPYATDVDQADTVFLLGATLNENNTFMSNSIKLIPSRVRVDNDPNILDQDKYFEYMLVADIRSFFQWLTVNEHRFEDALARTKAERKRWLAEIRKIPFFDPDAGRDSTEYPMHPSRVVAELRQSAPKNTVLVADSGANTVFSVHNWTCYAPNDFFLLSTTGPMGYSISMAIGIKMARPLQPVLVIIGDGDIAMHGIEFATAVRYQIPMVVVILDNYALGNVYLAVEKYGENAEELAEIPKRDWSLFAKAMGGDGVYVDKYEELAPAFETAFKSKKPFIVDVSVGKNYATPNTIAPDLPGPYWGEI